MSYETDTKTSIAAILGFVVSLIGCCLPTGLLGAVLGVFGLIGIGRSGGRVGGKGLAIAAIIIGILSTLIQIGLVVGGLTWARQVFPFGVQSGEFLSHLEASEYDEARTLLVAPLNGADDASLAAFSQAVQDDLGKFVSAPDSLGSLWSGWMELGQQLSSSQIPMSVPIALQFEQERAMAQYVFDPQTMAGTIPAMADIQITTINGDNYRLSDYVSGPGTTIPALPDADAGSVDPEIETDDGP